MIKQFEHLLFAHLSIFCCLLVNVLTREWKLNFDLKVIFGTAWLSSHTFSCCSRLHSIKVVIIYLHISQLVCHWLVWQLSLIWICIVWVFILIISSLISICEKAQKTPHSLTLLLLSGFVAFTFFILLLIILILGLLLKVYYSFILNVFILFSYYLLITWVTRWLINSLRSLTCPILRL